MGRGGDAVLLAGRPLGPERHVWAVFPSRDEDYRTLLPFVLEGFARGEKAIHVLDPALQEDHLAGAPTMCASSAGMAERVCAITGVGPGNGAAFSRRFAAGGHRVAMLDAARVRRPARRLLLSAGGDPDAVCHVAHQDRSAWTFEVDPRPFGERW